MPWRSGKEPLGIAGARFFTGRRLFLSPSSTVAKHCQYFLWLFISYYVRDYFYINILVYLSSSLQLAVILNPSPK